MGCRKTCKVEKLLKQSHRDVVWSQRQRLTTSKKNSRMSDTDKPSSWSRCWLLFCPANTVGNACHCIGPLTAAAKLRNEVLPHHLPSVQHLDSFRLLEDSSSAPRLNPETLSHQRLKQKLLSTEKWTGRNTGIGEEVGGLKVVLLVPSSGKTADYGS
ncbi:RIMS-binding protein 2 isoform X1 [Lates japonicus]|uniref:RIMS-binding protein 2 isoform X1 n=1 Tax=Lates japonicus TaxID=270547 RepID=A0AAD3MEY2_LATJO|nr:RIMS-binding protein 2 isoform X1 [Lates japonicus]